ncbi:MAG: hypothetical protein AAFQ98_13985 [Bacteroidota bacterium]
MLRFTTLFILISLFGMYDAQAQSIRRSSVFLELAGSGGLASLNYERAFAQGTYTEYAWRAGFSLAPIDQNNGVGLVFPVMAVALIGPANHQLELGLGQGITLTTRGSFFALTTAAVGYRYQSPRSPWFFRATYTPLISYLLDFQVQQWAGLSLGYTFNPQAK